MLSSRIGLRFISKARRRQVWLRYNPHSFFGKCYCCNKTIDAHFFEAAHVQAKSLGGSDRLDNLRPTCKECNRDMRTENLYCYIHRKNFK